MVDLILTATNQHLNIVLSILGNCCTVEECRQPVGKNIFKKEKIDLNGKTCVHINYIFVLFQLLHFGLLDHISKWFNFI